MSEQIYGLGCVEAPPDPRDHHVSAHMALAALELPRRFVLPADRVPAPLNQGNTPRCVGYAGALNRSITEYFDAGRRIVPIDPDDAYALAKQFDGMPGEPGSTVRALCEGMLKVGGLVKGTSERRKIDSYGACASAADIKQAILGGGDERLMGAVQVGGPWPDAWMRVGASGILTPVGYAVLRASGAGHSRDRIGWDDDLAIPDGTRGAWLERNSWGYWGVTVDGIAACMWVPYSNDYVWEARKTFDAPDPLLTLEALDMTLGFATVVRVSLSNSVQGMVHVAIPAGAFPAGARLVASLTLAPVSGAWQTLTPRLSSAGVTPSGLDVVVNPADGQRKTAVVDVHVVVFAIA